MTGLTEIAAIAGLAGAAVGAVSSVASGQAQANAAAFNAEVAQQQAERERQIAEREAADFRRQQSRVLAASRARRSGSANRTAPAVSAGAQAARAAPWALVSGSAWKFHGVASRASEATSFGRSSASAAASRPPMQ